MKKIMLISLVSLLFMINCVSVSVIPLGDSKFYQNNKNILVFSSRASVNRPFKEIAILRANTSDGDFVSDDQMIESIIGKAQEIGADAVIYEEQSERGGGGAFIGKVYFQDEHKSFRVTAIRFTEINNTNNGIIKSNLVDDIIDKTYFQIMRISGQYLMININDIKINKGDKFEIYRGDNKIGDAETIKIIDEKAALKYSLTDKLNLMMTDKLLKIN